MKRLFAALVVGLSACVTGQASAPVLSDEARAHSMLQHGDSAGAVAIFERLAVEHPADLGLARGLAEAHVKNGTGQALLDRLAATDTAQSHYARGLVLFSRSADASGPAVTEFRRAVELDPGQPEYSFRLGVALLESEKYDEAKASLTRAVAAAPERWSWLLPLAKAQHRTGDTRLATASIRAVIDHEPSEADAKTAKALMEQIADPFVNFPRPAKAALEQGLNWLQVADIPQQAIVQFEEILHDYPDLAVVHALLGLAYSRVDDAGRAVDELRRAVELAPDDGKNQLYLGELYLGRQRAKQAKEHFEKAVEHNPTLATAWFHLADMALEKNELDEAHKAYFIASRLAPDDTNAHGKLALVYQLEGNWPAADRELKAVLDKDADNVEFMLRLGVLHTERFTKAKNPAEKKEAAAEASKWLEKVIEAQPENALASRALERVKRP